MEICIDSVESAVNAAEGGASRLELCSNLVEGGTTPSLGMLRVIKKMVDIPVFVMIRPRGGDFLYTDTEFQVMVENVSLMKKNGADGIVFGILNADGAIDERRSQTIIDLSRPLPVTFHRAFDMVREPERSLHILIKMGVDRVLTSGLDSTALEGLPVIRNLVKIGRGKITVVPGGGINERNLERILVGSGAVEYHCSARSSRSSVMGYCNSAVNMGASFGPPEFSVKVADKEKVFRLQAISKTMYVHMN